MSNRSIDAIYLKGIATLYGILPSLTSTLPSVAILMNSLACALVKLRNRGFATSSAGDKESVSQPRLAREEQERVEGKWTTLQIITVLQFFVGGLVTFGGIEFARSGVYPLGTALGLMHISVGIAGLFAGYAILRGGVRFGRLTLAVNGLTIGYSVFSETLAQLDSLLGPGFTPSLIGTVVAVVVSSVIMGLLLFKQDNE